MRIRELSVHNYRTLKNIVLRFSSDYCTLSGKNNAGKSSVIRLLGHLMEPNRRPWHTEEYSLDYREDCTQWSTSKNEITLKWIMVLSLSDDPALIEFIETFAETEITSEEIDITVTMEVDSNSTQTSVQVGDMILEERPAREIVTKLRQSNCLFLYNSADQDNRFIYASSGRRQSFYDFYLSEDEQKVLSDAAKVVQRKTRQLAKGHRDVLQNLLGKLNEKYDVEFTTPEGYRSREMPLGINLKDRKVKVPIDDWGSGTQNRTYILMSLLQAKRIKELEGSEEKITPIVVLEEPESFLHPAAQAEF